MNKRKIKAGIRKFRLYRRKALYVLLTLLLVLTSIQIWNYFQPKEAEAGWYDEGWAYRQKVTIGNTGSADSNKRVKFDFNTSSLISGGKMQTSCQDIRVTDANGKILKHYVPTSGGASGGPTNIDDASNFGFMPEMGRQVVRDSSGNLFAALNDGGSIEVWKSSDGSSWTEQDSSNNPSAISGSGIALAIDSADTLHIVYSNGAFSYTLYHITFSGTTFGTEETIDTVSGASEYTQLSVTIDSNDEPHVVFDPPNSILNFILTE